MENSCAGVVAVFASCVSLHDAVAAAGRISEHLSRNFDVMRSCELRVRHHLQLKQGLHCQLFHRAGLTHQPVTRPNLLRLTGEVAPLTIAL